MSKVKTTAKLMVKKMNLRCEQNSNSDKPADDGLQMFVLPPVMLAILVDIDVDIG